MPERSGPERYFAGVHPEPHRLTALRGIRSEFALTYPDGSVGFGRRAFVAGASELYRDEQGRVVLETHADVELA